ncbi:MAG: hypothetical protein AB1847_06275 [bacterium]
MPGTVWLWLQFGQHSDHERVSRQEYRCQHQFDMALERLFFSGENLFRKEKKIYHAAALGTPKGILFTPYEQTTIAAA